MSGDGAWALHQGIYAALSGDGPLKTLIGDPARVYDDVPTGTAFPYVTLGDIATLDWSTASERAFEHRVTLHVWSRYGGRKECRAITAAIYDVLHDADLTLDGHRLISLFFQAADVFRDPDGETTHGLARYRARTAPL